VRLPSVLATRDRQFFDLFEEAGGNILRAARLLEEMLEDFPERNELAREILLCEQEGDRITHDILHRYAQTPARRSYFESQDIHTLAVRLDDIVDFTEACADQLSVYGVEAPMTQAQELAEVLVLGTEQVSAALRGYRNGGDIASELVEIHRLENEGDRLHRDAVASLFAAGIDPMFVIRWKDIFESLEQAVDACESVANVMEGIVLKRRR
jgi:uncharacterized protein